jgi:hypothetical protein
MTEKQTAVAGRKPSKEVATAGPKAGVTLFGMIKDAKKLNAGIVQFLADYKDIGDRAHIFVVSAIYHACVHGNPAPFNTLFAGLRPNDQGAVRLYVRRIQIISGMDGVTPDGENLASEVIAAALDAGKVLDITQGQWRVVRGHTSPEAKRLAKLCEDRFLNPDGETDKMVFARNNFAEVRTLSEADVVEQIESNIRSYLDNKSARRQISLSEGIRTKLTKMADTVGTWKNQLSLSDG